MWQISEMMERTMSLFLYTTKGHISIKREKKRVFSVVCGVWCVEIPGVELSV